MGVDEAMSGLVRRYLAGHDAPCVVCDQNLRGVVSDRCPECGAQLELRVGSPDVRLGAWITALVGVAVPLGFLAILGCLMLLSAILGGVQGRREWIVVIVTWIATVILGLTLGAVIRGRSALLGRTRRERWLIAALATIAAWVLAVGLCVLMANNINF